MNPDKARRTRSLFLAGLVSLAYSAGSEAAQWSKSFGITPEVIFTDNTCLEADNEKSEWIGVANTSASLQGEGARAYIDLVGTLRFHTLENDPDKCERGGGNSNEDSPVPTFRFDAGTELVKDTLFVDVYSNATQNRSNAFGPGGSDGLNRSGNENTSYSYGVRPYLTGKLGRLTNFQLSYNYDEQRNTEIDRDDSTRNSAQLNLESLPGQNKLFWSIVADYQDIEYKEEAGLAPNNELKSVQFTLGYQINRKWSINGFVGKEDNSFVSASDEIDGDIWGYGVTWTPNNRITLNLGGGERFFGNIPSVDLSYRHRRSTLSVSYGKELRYSRDLRNLNPPFAPNDSFDEPVDPLGGEQLDPLGTPTSTSRSPILDERLTVTWRFQGRVHSVGANVSYSEQKRADTGQVSNFNGIRLNASRQLAGNLSLDTDIGWDESKTDDPTSVLDRSSETWRFNLGLTYAFGQRTNMALLYTFTDRDSDEEVDSYTENRVSLRFDLRF